MSSTMPTSATRKMGALGFLLMAMMNGLPFSPARCWNEPLIPQAMYTLGRTVLPDEPTCRDLSIHLASTTGREQLTAAPMASAKSSAMAMFSCSPMPRPTETSTGSLGDIHVAGFGSDGLQVPAPRGERADCRRLVDYRSRWRRPFPTAGTRPAGCSAPRQSKCRSGRAR